MTTKASSGLTASALARIPPDGLRHELVGGEEFVTPAPDVGHQRSSRKLEFLLDAHVTRARLGEVFDAPIDVVLSDGDVVQPDILFVSTERSGIVGCANVTGAPDLIVEILSPSTALLDRGRKLDLYRRSGVREYWIVDRAARQVELHVFAPAASHAVVGEAGAIESALLPGLRIEVAAIL